MLPLYFLLLSMFMSFLFKIFLFVLSLFIPFSLVLSFLTLSLSPLSLSCYLYAIFSSLSFFLAPVFLPLSYSISLNLSLFVQSTLVLSFLSFFLTLSLSLSLSLCCPLSAIAADNRKNMTIVFRELRPSEGKHLATLLIGCRLLILPHCFKREFKRRRIRRRRRSKSFPDADDASKGSKDRRWLE